MRKFLLPKLKFGAGSIIATLGDYGLFFFLLKMGLQAWLAQGMAHTFGMVINFVIQRNFIFSKERSMLSSFAYSFIFSMLAIILSSISIHVLFKLAVFNDYPILPKLIVTGILFFFNFYTKQFSFERKITW